MLSIGQVRGVIFDVDETLLDTNVKDPMNGFHEQARLQAMREAGRRQNIPALAAITPEENAAFYAESPIHTIEGVTWTGLQKTGVVPADKPLDLTNLLLLEIIGRKDVLYAELLRRLGKPVDGSPEFVAALVARNIPVAIASGSTRRDADIFLRELTSLHVHFPEERIITKELVNNPKPHPEAFDKAFRSLGLPDAARGYVLAFEDHPRGVASAKAARLFTCAITTVTARDKLASLPAPPDLIASSFHEFAQLLGLY
jgi:beta-phosphoglucomutase-like phosphatase (HAD superfamily)